MDQGSKRKLYSLLGLAAKSGNIKSGSFQVEKAVQNGKASLVIVAEDASANTKKLFSDKCSFYHIPVREFGSKAELGKCLGKEERSAAAVLDRGLAEVFSERLDGAIRRMHGEDQIV